MMKRVWILNHYAAEPNGVGGTRHFHIAEYLRALEWDSTIIASSVEHNTGRQRLDRSKLHDVQVVDGVRFLWIRVPNYVGNGVRRLANMLSYTLRVLVPSHTRILERPHIIVGSSVHPFAAVSAVFLARRFRVPFVFEVRDLWPQTLIDLGKLEVNSPLAKIMRLMERWLYRQADRIITLLPDAADYIVPLGIESEKIVWIPNGVDLKRFPREKVREHDGVFTLMYFGAHGHANSLGVLIDAMALVVKVRDDVSLRMVGDGPEKRDLMERARDLGLGSNIISFESQIKKSDIPALASTADAFVIHVPSRPELYRYGISPNKLFDYLAAGRPLLMACDLSISMSDKAGCGITVKPEDAHELAQAILKLAETPTIERQKLGDRAREHVELHYGFSQLSQRFSAVLDESIAIYKGRQ